MRPMARAQLALQDTPPPAPAARSGQVTGIRLLVLNRAREMSLTLADVSRAIHRSDSYVHAYIHKGTPKRLDPDVREALGIVLKLNPDSLREPDDVPTGLPIEGAKKPDPIRAEPIPRMAIAPPSGRQVPLYRIGDTLDPTTAEQFVPPFPSSAGPAACAILIDTTAARLSPGDTCYAKSEQVVRRGDMVVVLDNAMRIEAVGELQAMTGTSVTIIADSEPAAYPRLANRLLKVIGTVYP